MKEPEPTATEAHARQLRTVQRTLDRVLTVVHGCQSRVKRLQGEVDELLYLEKSTLHERPEPAGDTSEQGVPRCGGTHTGTPPGATHLVWTDPDGQPLARCYECARRMVDSERTSGQVPHASPILAGPPCQGTRCRRGRRRHATVRVVTEHNRRGTAYCQGCGELARRVLAEQGIVYETAAAAARPVAGSNERSREAA